jgi:hypothetical protein
MDEFYKAIFCAAKPDAAYTPESGIVKFWKENYKLLGPALTDEGKVGRRPVQAFLGGIVEWDDAKGASIV